jgi:hypothetical protein
MKKIRCIGFSVTGFGEPSYPEVMQSYFYANGPSIDVSFCKLSGLSIDALPYLMSSIIRKEDNIDLVILEITTSWFSLYKKGVNEADPYIDLIVNYIQSIGASILFLNLYRKELSDFCNVVSGINKYVGKYPILSLKKYYRDQYHLTGSDGTKDGVHPTQDSINYIAEIVCKFINENSDSFKHKVSSNSDLTMLEINKFDLLEGLFYCCK